MKAFLDRFVLGFPVLFLKQYPYAWIAVVALWVWPPSFSLIFLAIVVIGLLMLRWQSRAWISNLRREHATPGGKFYVTESPFSLASAAWKVLVLLAGAALLAWLLNGQFGLGFWKIFLIIAGFTLFYQDTRFFGAQATYAITDQGIGIRFVPGHLDYRLFIFFKEISRIERCEYQEGKAWDLFGRTQATREGLLLIPKNPDGFTKRIDKLFIIPGDIEKFIEQLPQGYM